MKILLSVCILITCTTAIAKSNPDSSEKQLSYQKAINIYIISKDIYFDFTNQIIVWQAKIASFLHGKKLKIIEATSTDDAEKKIALLVQKHHYTISNLWFDSHGKFRKGYSSFMLGSDEYDYKNIGDPDHIIKLKKIASYCSAKTKIAIGACYAAADYNFPVMKNGIYNNMHGDSLIKGIADIFKGSTIYASKSWVMAKPWIFGSKNAMAGFPLDRQYKDSIFLPVWKSMGEWQRYSSSSQKIENINSVYLSHSGDILMQNEPYLAKKKSQRKLARNLRKLRPNLYTLKK